MKRSVSHFRAPEWVILVGALGFMLMLAISASLDAQIRWLHFFQSWMYVATIALSCRQSRWGYFLGVSVAGFWDYMNVFASSFFWNGLQQLYGWTASGHLSRPDLLIAVPAWFSNLLVVVGVSGATRDCKPSLCATEPRLP